MKAKKKSAELGMLDEQTAGTIRNFLSVAVLHQRETAQHSKESDVVRLALELARLRGQQEPGQFLDEAARLLTEARKALSREMNRPAREAEEQKAELENRLAEMLAPSCTWTYGAEKQKKVPFNLLFKAGKSEPDYDSSGRDESLTVNFIMQNEDNPPQVIKFTWERYTTRRGFKELLESVVKREDPQLAFTQNEHLAKILKGKVSKLFQRLEVGKWPIEDVYTLHGFRNRASSERSRKAMETRQAKRKNSKGGASKPAKVGE